MIDDAFIDRLRAGPLRGLDGLAVDIFFARVDLVLPDLRRALEQLYPDRPDLSRYLQWYLEIAAARYAGRPEELRLLDLRRQAAPDWYQQPRMAGYSCYVDRFAGDLAGVEKRIGYLEELGVTYLHLMPLLTTREGENDGGYAVADYRTVDPRLGTMEDLSQLAAALRRAGISLCVDVVCNHTADTHEWARRALAGDRAYQDYYVMFPDREMPDRYEATLREVFPNTAPGNFIWREEIGRWVWTTFNEFQWDLNYANPAVLGEMADVILSLANRGAEIIRLDAVAFLWKTPGTSCENLPQAHAVLQFWRALTRIAAPGLLLLAEAIVPLEHTVPYLGVGEATGKECELAYHHFFMVLLWSSLAEQKATMMTNALRRIGPLPRSGSWCTYVRSHDDIGWALTPGDTGTVGLDDQAHRDFLSDFYSGAFPGSFARGEVFQPNPATGDRRISGTTASLAGLEHALEAGDEVARELAFRRIRLLHALVAVHGGIPIIWSGDEIGQMNDHDYLEVPDLADDNRWIHRPPLARVAASMRHDPTTVAGRVHADLRRTLEARRSSPELHAAAEVTPVSTGAEAVFGLLRSGPRGRLLALANVAPGPQTVPRWRLRELGFSGAVVDRLGGGEVFDDDDVVLEEYGVVWLAAAP